MRTKSSAILAGIAALLIAGSVLAVSIYSGNNPIPPTQQTSSTNSITSSYVTSPSTTSTSTSTSTQTPISSVSGASQGTVSILVTDPPNVPNGVTKVYVTYANLAIHVSESDSNNGWREVQSQGTIELMSTVNVGQTISSVNIASGDYNLIRLNVSSAQVTYNGKNYTAFVPSSRLLIPIIGGIEVNSSKPSATIINITPTVLNIGSKSDPEFIIRPVAKALPVPSSQVSEQMEHKGYRFDLVGKAWWQHLEQRYTANAQATAASLTANSLAVTVKNTGNRTTALRLVMVVPLATADLTGNQRPGVPSAFFNSAIFIVEKNGTLVPLSSIIQSMISSGGNQSFRLDMRHLMYQLLTKSGLNLTAGSSANLTYNGPITFGFQLKNVASAGVVSGQQYIVTVMGDESLASIVVVAK